MKPILYADDDENDQFLMERAFARLGLESPLKLVADGNSALDYLQGCVPYANREENPLPSLVLLDLSMPGKNGFSVLQWIRDQPGTASIPVLVFTSSSQDSDIYRAYAMGATGYLVKPGDPDDLLEIVKKIEQCWLSKTHPASSVKELPAFKPCPVNGGAR